MKTEMTVASECMASTLREKKTFILKAVQLHSQRMRQKNIWAWLWRKAGGAALSISLCPAAFPPLPLQTLPVTEKWKFNSVLKLLRCFWPGVHLNKLYSRLIYASLPWSSASSHCCASRSIFCSPYHLHCQSSASFILISPLSPNIVHFLPFVHLLVLSSPST